MRFFTIWALWSTKGPGVDAGEPLPVSAAPSHLRAAALCNSIHTLWRRKPEEYLMLLYQGKVHCCRFDLGTADELALDVLINALVNLSQE